MHRAVGEAGIEDACMQRAEARQRIFLVVLPIVGLGPFDGVVVVDFDNKNRVRGPFLKSAIPRPLSPSKASPSPQTAR